MKKFASIVLGISLVITLFGCQESGSNNISISVDDDNILPNASMPDVSTIRDDSTQTNWPNESLFKEIYHNDSCTYSILSSELIDTYFIACGLYFDFQSNFLFSQDMEIDHQETIDHFSRYKEHEFIKQLSCYVDEENRYAPMDILFYLPQYAIAKKTTGEDIENIQSAVFQGADGFYQFMDGLYRFYTDSQAETFFEQSKARQDLEHYFNNSADSVPITGFINTLESYAGNKTSIFPNQTVHYYSLVSLYKSPYNATFHTYQINNDTYLVSFQSPFGFDGGLSIHQTVETAIHESLHAYINPGIEAENDLIELIAKNKNTSDFTSPIYYSMPWYRITDEAIVRAVQSRVYGEVYQDYDKAFNQILNKEIQSGIANLEPMFHALGDYEENRTTYPTLKDFLPILIPVYFGET